MKEKKILFLTPAGFDTPNPNNQMAIKLISQFTENNYCVHLIQSNQHGPNDFCPDELKANKKIVIENIERKKVNKKNFIYRYINEMAYSFKSFLKWRKLKDYDVVFLQSYPAVIFQIFLLKLFSKKPIIYNVYDVFPGHAYDIGVVKNKFIFICLKNFQKLAYYLTDKILVLSIDMKTKIEQEGKELSKKIVVVPPWFDDEKFKKIPINKNKFIEKYNIKQNIFYVQFAGTIGYVFDYNAIIACAEILKPYENIVFQMIGEGAEKQEFIKKANQKNLNNIEFLPLQPLNLVADVYSSCSICIVPLKKGVIGNGVPSKVPLLMSLGKVVVTSVETDSRYAKEINDNGIGFAESNEDYTELAEKILFLYKNPQKLKEMEKKSKEFSSNYSSTKSIDKIIEVFKDWETN